MRLNAPPTPFYIAGAALRSGAPSYAEWRADRHPRTAFTLIELLVIIANMAILAAILFPVFAQARDKSRQATCQSNLKQLGMAIMMYVQDYDESYPLYAMFPDQVSHWYDLINQYIKARNFTSSIYFCPSVTKKSIGGNEAAGYGVNFLHVIQYPSQFSATWGPSPCPSRNFGPARMASLSRPANTFMITDTEQDCGPHQGSGWAAIYCPIELPQGPSWAADACVDKTWGLAKRHAGGGNYLMADGHNQWMRRDAVLGASLDPGKEMWGHYGE
jgi:prepilin-type processing-associated H-X9-DG protein